MIQSQLRLLLCQKCCRVNSHKFCLNALNGWLLCRHYLVPNVPNTINGMCQCVPRFGKTWTTPNHAKLKIINDSIKIQWSMPVLEVTGNVSASKHLINLVITEGFTFQLRANLQWHVFGIRLWKAYHMHSVLTITLVGSLLSSNVGHFRRSQNALFLLSLSKFAQ